jgi:hypothetical protein
LYSRYTEWTSCCLTHPSLALVPHSSLAWPASRCSEVDGWSNETNTLRPCSIDGCGRHDWGARRNTTHPQPLQWTRFDASCQLSCPDSAGMRYDVHLTYVAISTLVPDWCLTADASPRSGEKRRRKGLGMCPTLDLCAGHRSRSTDGSLNFFLLDVGRAIEQYNKPRKRRGEQGVLGGHDVPDSA